MSFTLKCLELFRFSKLLCFFFVTFTFFFTTKSFKDKLTAPKLSGFKNLPPQYLYKQKMYPPKIIQSLHLINNDCSLSFALLVLKKVGMNLNGTNVLYTRSLPLS